MRIEPVEDLKIDQSLDAAIRRLQTRAFPCTEAFTRSRHYVHQARPGDMRVLAWQEDMLVGQAVLLWARGEIERRMLKVAAIGNVCSDPDCRGQGIATDCVERALALACEGQAELSVLFCGPNRQTFYERLGYHTAGNEVRLTRPDGTTYVRPRKDLFMVLPLSLDVWPEGELTLDIEDF